MDFKKWVKNIQTASYNGAGTVFWVRHIDLNRNSFAGTLFFFPKQMFSSEFFHNWHNLTSHQEHALFCFFLYDPTKILFKKPCTLTKYERSKEEEQQANFSAVVKFSASLYFVAREFTMGQMNLQSLKNTLFWLKISFWDIITSASMWTW